MKRILFTTIAKPVKPLGAGYDPLDLFSSRLTAGQDVFTHKHYTPVMSLHYIASNLDAKSVVLEYPSQSQLLKDIKTDYDFVCITCFNRTILNVLDVCRLIRKHATKSKIVLGGYGVQALLYLVEKDKSLNKLFDYICSGEGVRFMRTLLGEDPIKPVTSHLSPQFVYPFGYKALAQSSPPLIVSFGCTEGCPFCLTSAFFKHKELLVMSPEQMVEQIKAYFLQYPDLHVVNVICENYLGDKDYAFKVRDLIESDPDIGFDQFSFGIFSSLKNISQYSVDELVEMGIGYIWIGFESKFCNYAKRQGSDFKTTVQKLQGAGIQVSSSFIIGFDNQTPANIKEDMDYFISIKPTYAQVSALIPAPGTKLWKHLDKEGRIVNRNWEEQHVYSEVMRFANFKPGEVISLINTTIEKSYQELGPSILRMIDVICSGIEKYENTKSEKLKRRRLCYIKTLTNASATLPGIIKFAPNKPIKKHAIDVDKRVVQILGKRGLFDILKSKLLMLLLLYNRISGHGQPGAIKQPKTRRSIYG